MISHQHRCLFIHVPKVAGQSIERVFLEWNGLTWKHRAPLLLRANSDSSMGPQRLAHLFAREYVELGHIDAARFADYFKFAFVRNPWDRLVSAYLHRRHYRGDFRSFVLEAEHLADPNLDLYRHLVPQVRYLYGPSGHCEVDFIGRFEHLERDFAYVCRALQMPAVRLPRSNVSRPKANLPAWLGRLGQFGRSGNEPYPAWYDASLRNRVAERYAADIECFGYEFGEDLPAPAPPGIPDCSVVCEGFWPSANSARTVRSDAGSES